MFYVYPATNNNHVNHESIWHLIKEYVDLLANPQLPSVTSMANPLDAPGRGSSLESETHPNFVFFILKEM